METISDNKDLLTKLETLLSTYVPNKGASEDENSQSKKEDWKEVEAEETERFTSTTDTF